MRLCWGMTHDQANGDFRSRFYPYVFFPEDMDRMELALRSALFACARYQSGTDAEQAARLVLRLYRMGLRDPEKLAMLAARMMAETLARQ